MGRVVAIAIMAGLVTGGSSGASSEPLVDIAADVGLGFDTRSYAAAAADFDGDGAMDLAVTFHRWRDWWDGEYADRIFRNVAGRFVTHQELPLRDRHDCAWGDATGDGRLDLYCTIGADKGEGVGENELWVQQATGAFVDEAADYGVTDLLGRGRATTFIDADETGNLDLFVGNAPSRPDDEPTPNRFFLGTSESAPQWGVDEPIGADCAVAHNVLFGGWAELLVCSKKRGLVLYQNRVGGSFADVTAQRGLSGVNAQRVQAADLDGDGQAELVTITRSAVAVWKWERPEFVVAHKVPLTWGNDVAVGDIDGDGDLDIYVQQTGSPQCKNSEGAWDDHPDFVLMRSGPTLGDWQHAAVPHTGRGCGDRVVAVDHDGDGADEFLVLNGDRESIGPIQLIAASASCAA